MVAGNNGQNVLKVLQMWFYKGHKNKRPGYLFTKKSACLSLSRPLRCISGGYLRGCLGHYGSKSCAVILYCIHLIPIIAY